MMLNAAETQYAAPERSGPSTIERQRKILSQHYGPLKLLYDAVSELILILNGDRQIVFFNSAVPSLLGVSDPESLYGQRPGEALECMCACNNPGGCGTSESCSQCGAVNAILSALSNKADLQECRLLKKDSVEAFDLLVRTTPITVEGEQFIIMAIIDISHEKRRRALERIFFHDIMNTAATVQLLATMLMDDPDGENAAAYRQNLFAGSKQLMSELCSQKELLAAENNELVAKKQLVDGSLLLEEVVEVFRQRYREHMIVVGQTEDRMPLKTDSGLLHRVLGNMIQNAIEASRHDEPVRVSCGVEDEWVVFRVHNRSYIPKDVQLRLFKRSFSTKAAGRGLGTYSMKLLSERYLDGSVMLQSSPQLGTTFTARYPRYTP